MTDTPHTPENTLKVEPLAFDDRTRRVMELRRRVREGTYRPDPEDVAKAILREWIGSEAVFVDEQPRPNIDTRSERKAAASRFVVEKSVRESLSEEAARTA